jgi:hypothetical protein
MIDGFVWFQTVIMAICFPLAIFNTVQLILTQHADYLDSKEKRQAFLGFSAAAALLWFGFFASIFIIISRF